MTYANPDALVSPEWLQAHLGMPDLRIVDASWFLPTEGRTAESEYEKCHIPGAVFFDIDRIADRNTTLPHMVPSPVAFSSACRELGLGDGLKIVIYDRAGGGCAAARAWWMFRLFGHKDVAVLDGGLGAWLAEERPVDDLPRPPGRRHFTPRMNSTLLRDAAAVHANIGSKAEQLVDARAADRFGGSVPEPRPVPRTGHIPGSLNLPFPELMDPETKRMKDADGIRATFDRAGVDLSKPIIATCGSGVTACFLALGAFLVGKEDVAVYDGSWTEWAEISTYPVERS